MQPEVFKVAIAKAAPINEFDFQVDAFSKSVAMPTVEVIQDSFFAMGQGSCEGSERRPSLCNGGMREVL